MSTIVNEIYLKNKKRQKIKNHSIARQNSFLYFKLKLLPLHLLYKPFRFKINYQHEIYRNKQLYCRQRPTTGC
jgi:hypothetical protein